MTQEPAFATPPNRLRVGDVWEFLTDVIVKGKKKPVEKLLQWEVIGWHNGQYAWELQSLDGEHKTYLMEFAPTYEEMRFIGPKSNALIKLEPEGPTDEELAETYRKAYYECDNRQGNAAQIFALRAVLTRWGK